MIVAGWTVHRPNGFFIVKEGYEYNLIIAVVAVGIAIIGPGRYSLDWALGFDFAFDPPVALRPLGRAWAPSPASDCSLRATAHR